MPIVGEVRILAIADAPDSNWLPCDGQMLQVQSMYLPLFNVIGTHWGGDGASTFAVPDLRGRVPVGAGSGNTPAGLSPRTVGDKGGAETVVLETANLPKHLHNLHATSTPANTNVPGPTVTLAMPASPGAFYTAAPSSPTQELVMDVNAVSKSGQSQPHNNMMPSLAFYFFICFRDDDDSIPLLGQVSIFAFNYAPDAWQTCTGVMLPRVRYGVLNTALGDAYGPGTPDKLQLPNMCDFSVSTSSQGCAPLATGTGPGLSPRPIQASQVGESAITLTTAQMPAHTHQMITQSAVASYTNDPNGAWMARGVVVNNPGPPPSVSGFRAFAPFASSKLVQLRADTIQSNGMNMPHENHQPWLALNFCIYVGRPS